MSRRRRHATIVPVVAVLALAAGVAVAYQTTTGAGSGTGVTKATTSPLVLSPGSVTTDLSPGGTAAVATTASNADDAAVRIGSLTLATAQGTGGFAVDAAHSGCGVSAFSFATQTNGGAGWSVPAGGTLTLNLPAAVSAGLSTGNACQGATLTVYLKATA